MRLCEAAFPGIREVGWHHATLTAFASPFVAAKMLDLDVEQTINAVGISASSATRARSSVTRSRSRSPAMRWQNASRYSRTPVSLPSASSLSSTARASEGASVT